MADINLVNLFTNIANAIRQKDGTTDSIVASDFPSKIAAIPTGGGELKTGTVTGNGTRTLSIQIEDNADDVIMFDIYKTSGASASAVFSVHFDANNQSAIVSNSSSAATYNTANLSVSRSGNTITLSFNAAFNFLNNAVYRYCYVV